MKSRRIIGKLKKYLVGFLIAASLGITLQVSNGQAHAVEPATVFLVIGAGLKLISFIMKQSASGADPSKVAIAHNRRSLHQLNERMNTFANGLTGIMIEINTLPERIRNDTQAIVNTLVQNEVIGSTKVLQESVEVWRGGGTPIIDPHEALRTLKQNSRTLFEYGDIATPIIILAMSYEIAYIEGLEGKGVIEIDVVRDAYKTRLQMVLDRNRPGSLVNQQKIAEHRWQQALRHEERNLDVAWNVLKDEAGRILTLEQCERYENPFQCRRVKVMIFGHGSAGVGSIDQLLNQNIQIRQEAYIAYVLDKYYQEIISAVRAVLNQVPEYEPTTRGVSITETAVPDCVHRGWADAIQCVRGLRQLYSDMYALMPIKLGRDFNDIVADAESTPARSSRDVPVQERRQILWATELVKKQNFWPHCYRSFYRPVRQICELKSNPIRNGRSYHAFREAIEKSPWWSNPSGFTSACVSIPYCRSPRIRFM